MTFAVLQTLYFILPSGSSHEHSVNEKFSLSTHICALRKINYRELSFVNLSRTRFEHKNMPKNPICINFTTETFLAFSSLLLLQKKTFFSLRKIQTIYTYTLLSSFITKENISKHYGCLTLWNSRGVFDDRSLRSVAETRRRLPL